jgi:hypothetical protein
MILLDIPPIPLRLGFVSLIICLTYQITLAVCTLIYAFVPVVGRPVSNRITKFIATAGGAPDHQAKQYTGAINYPYFWVIWNLLLFQLSFGRKGLEILPHFTKPSQSPRLPNCPVLYIYGARKPFHFHDNKTIDVIKARKGNVVIPMATGHWITNKSDELNKNIKSFISQ